MLYRREDKKTADVNFDTAGLFTFALDAERVATLVPDPQATADAALGRMVRGMPTGSVLVHGMMGWTAGMFSRVEYDFNGPQCDMPEAALAALEEEAADDDEIR